MFLVMMMVVGMVGCGGRVDGVSGDGEVSISPSPSPAAQLELSPVGESWAIPLGQQHLALCRLEPTVETDLLRKSWELALANFRTCEQRLKPLLESCSFGSGSECDQVRLEYSRCLYKRDMGLNEVPRLLCGASIVTVPEVVKPEEYTDREGVSVLDADGDGLNNYLEFTLGMNPCSKQSYFHCPTDFQVDSDGDGLVNGEDPFPACHQAKPLAECAPPK